MYTSQLQTLGTKKKLAHFTKNRRRSSPNECVSTKAICEHLEERYDCYVYCTYFRNFHLGMGIGQRKKVEQMRRAFIARQVLRFGRARKCTCLPLIYFISCACIRTRCAWHAFARSGIHIPLFVGWVIFILICICICVHWAIEAWTYGMSESHETTARHAVNVIRCIKPLNSADKQRINSGRRLPQYQRNYYYIHKIHKCVDVDSPQINTIFLNRFQQMRWHSFFFIFNFMFSLTLLVIDRDGFEFPFMVICYFTPDILMKRKKKLNWMANMNWKEVHSK